MHKISFKFFFLIYWKHLPARLLYRDFAKISNYHFHFSCGIFQLNPLKLNHTFNTICNNTSSKKTQIFIFQTLISTEYVAQSKRQVTIDISTFMHAKPVIWRESALFAVKWITLVMILFIMNILSPSVIVESGTNHARHWCQEPRHQIETI